MTDSQKIFAENLWDQLKLRSYKTLQNGEVISLTHSKSDFLIALEKGLEGKNIVDLSREI